METNREYRISKQQFWKGHLEEQKISRLSQRAYCQREGLKQATFQYWKRRLRGKPSQSRLRFVPISRLPQPQRPEEFKQLDASCSPRIRLHLAEVQIEVPVGVDLDWLQALVRALGGGPHVEN